MTRAATTLLPVRVGGGARDSPLPALRGPTALPWGSLGAANSGPELRGRACLHPAPLLGPHPPATLMSTSFEAPSSQQPTLTPCCSAGFRKVTAVSCGSCSPSGPSQGQALLSLPPPISHGGRDRPGQPPPEVQLHGQDAGAQSPRFYLRGQEELTWVPLQTWALGPRQGRQRSGVHEKGGFRRGTEHHVRAPCSRTVQDRSPARAPPQSGFPGRPRRRDWSNSYTMER